MVLVQGALFGEPGGNTPRPIPGQPVVVLLPYAGGLTVLQVLEQLGGPTPLARAERGSVLRAATGVRIPVDVAALWEIRDPGLDLLLEPGDQLHVPMRDLNVYVAGEVNVPTAVPYQPSLTIGDYLRAAGGLTEDGGTDFTVIDADHARSRGTLFTQAGTRLDDNSQPERLGRNQERAQRTGHRRRLHRRDLGPGVQGLRPGRPMNPDGLP